MSYFKALFVFFVLFSAYGRAESSWEDSWESSNETESIDSGDIDTSDVGTSDIDTGDVDTGDVSGEKDAGGKKNMIEESAKVRTKEALKGFLDDALGNDE